MFLRLALLLLLLLVVAFPNNANGKSSSKLAKLRLKIARLKRKIGAVKKRKTKAKARKAKKTKTSKKKRTSKCRRFPSTSSFNPLMFNNVRSSNNDNLCAKRIVRGRSVCATRPGLLMKVGSTYYDHWITDKPIVRYMIRPGAPPRVKQATVEKKPGAELYFNAAPLRLIVDETGTEREMVFTWVRKAGPGWLRVDYLPAHWRAAVRARTTKCTTSKQTSHSCIRRPASNTTGARKCEFRSSNPSSMANLLKYGFVHPRPNFRKGQRADSEDILSHYMLRPMSIYNININLPQSKAATIAYDFVLAGDAFWIHPSSKARQYVPVFFGGYDCAKTYIKWVYGAPARQSDPNQPDWSRAGWTPFATLIC